MLETMFNRGSHPGMMLILRNERGLQGNCLERFAVDHQA